MPENERETEAEMIQRRAQAKAALDAGLKVREPGEGTDAPGTGKREAQDRAKGEAARSPVDSMHVDAPKKQDNARGHAAEP